MYFLQFIDHREAKNIPNKQTKNSEKSPLGDTHHSSSSDVIFTRKNVSTTWYVYPGAAVKLKIFGRMDYMTQAIPGVFLMMYTSKYISSLVPGMYANRHSQ